MEFFEEFNIGPDSIHMHTQLQSAEVLFHIKKLEKLTKGVKMVTFIELKYETQSFKKFALGLNAKYHFDITNLI